MENFANEPTNPETKEIMLNTASNSPQDAVAVIERAKRYDMHPDEYDGMKDTLDTDAKLDEIIPNDYIDRKLQFGEADGNPDNYEGVLRDLMMMSNPQKYFKTAWKGSWFVYEGKIELVESYVGNFRSILKKNKIDIFQE